MSQVCLELQDPDTRKREFDGLLEAMQRFGLKSGTIIKLNEKSRDAVKMDHGDVKF